MRHLIGLILAVALAAAVFFGGGWGAEHVSALAGHSVGLPSRTGLIGLAVMLGLGLLAGVLLLMRPVSPLATGLPGLVLLGWSALLAVSARHALAWIPLQAYSYGAGFRALLLNGTLAFAGIALVLPLFLPGRWHGTRGGEDDEDDVLELPAPTGMLS